MVVTPDLPWPFPKTPDYIVGLGVITLPGSSLAHQVFDFVLATTQVNDIVNSSVSKAQKRAAKQAEANGLEAQRISNVQEKQRLQATVNNLTTGQALSVSLEAPQAEQVAIDGVSVGMKLLGANPKCIDPTLNLPTRVRILINGQEYQYRMDDASA